MILKIREDRQMRALTGLSEKKFKVLLPTFEKNYYAQKQKEYEQGMATDTRKRKPGGGRKSNLKEIEDKLAFIYVT